MRKFIATAVIVVLGVQRAAWAAANFVVCDFDAIGKADAGENTTIAIVSEHAAAGQKAVRAECGAKGWPGVYVHGFPADWSGVKFLAFDVFNAGKQAVELCGWVKDDPGAGLFSRYNYQGLMAEPGQHTVRLWLANALKSNAFPLNKKNIQGFMIGPYEGQGAATLFFSNFRLEPMTDEKLPDVLPILDFEADSQAGKFEIEDWPEEQPGKSTWEFTDQHVTEGKRALKIEFRANGGNIQGYAFMPDWSQHDFLMVDCFNPTDEVVELAGWFKDSPRATYYARYNYSGLMIRPGASTLRLPLSGLLRGESAGSGPIREALNRTSMVRFNMGTPVRKTPLTLYFDNFRLVRSSMARFEGPGIRKFCFTRNIALAFPGFTPVNNQTAYDKAYGYGWKGKLASDAQCGCYEYPSDLLANFVPGHEFDVDLPNGKYRVTFYAESANYWEPMTEYHDRKVVANGKTVIDDRWTTERYNTERFFRHADTEDLPGEDHWEKYVKPRWQPFTFDAEVTDGGLRIQFDDPRKFESDYPPGDWPLNCLMVYPVDEAGRFQTWSKELEAEQKKVFALAYSLLPAPVPPRPAQLPASLAEKEYALFVPDYFKDVYYSSVPEESELNVKEIALAAAPGQYEAAAIGVFPVKALGKTTVAVSPLKAADGKALADKAVTAHRIRYKIMRRGTGDRFVYSIIPRIVDPEDWADIGAGVTRSFHVIAHVPADAAPGEYRGTITVTPANGKPASLPIRLTVLPIRLVEDRDFDLTFFGTGIGTTLDVTLRDMREHGLTTTTGPGYASYYNGQIEMKSVEAFVKAYHAAGFDGNYFVAYGTGQIYGPGNPKEMADAYTKFCARLAELGRTRLMLSLADEPSKDTTASVHEHYLKTIERLKPYQGIPGLATCGFYAGIEELIPWFEVSVLGAHDEAFLKKVREAGKKAWTYGGPNTRFGMGFYSAKLKEAGVLGQVHWHYQAAQGDVFNSLDGREEDHGMAFPLPGNRLADAVVFDRCRTGVDDFRYYTTLRQLIAEKKDAPAAAEGRKLVDEILASITIGNSGGFKDSKGPEDDIRRCREFRGRIIETILKLQK